MMIAPVTTVVCARTGCVTCWSMSSTFSTSRTTFVWTSDDDVREWKPIERLWRRSVSALRRSAPICRTAPMKSFV